MPEHWKRHAVAAFWSALALFALAEFALDRSLAPWLNSAALESIPLFALAGELAAASGIAGRILDVVDAFVRGADARCVLGCAAFATVSGVGPAAVRAEGARLLPDMPHAGRAAGRAAGLLAASAGLSIIIPASVPLTVYAAVTGTRTNIIFTASFVPGVLTAAALLAVVLARGRARGGGNASATLPRPARSLALRRAGWSLGLPLLVLSSLFTGVFTAPQAAAFACAYAACVGVFAHRMLTKEAAAGALARVAATASVVLLTAGVGGAAVALLEAHGLTEAMAAALFSLCGGRIGAILCINAALLLAGCFMSMPSIIILIVPLFLPLARMAGLGVPQFGAMAAVNLAIGLITPPHAATIAAAAKVAGVGKWTAARGALPSLCAMLLCLGAVAFVPEISLWLPRVFGWIL